ncbi:molybdopterin-dependent oxidoreductase [Phycicoccus sp. Root101]|uniref:molybdopterin-dependent oxidoreductase n=1 Tax=Phycicoccus sp. Root101 TaxID=1736421 RepID=UPI0009E7688F|nr:molybdopterin-dependent oxidoreductase [Phycicoccus sp. Root101]
MTTSEGFVGRRLDSHTSLPPGQYLTEGFPVLSAGPTPNVSTDDWRLSVTGTSGEDTEWDMRRLLTLGVEDIRADLHCVTGWSKLSSPWRGVPLESVLAPHIAETTQHVLVHSYGGYTTNVPLADLLNGQAWLAHSFAGGPLSASHGGPVRLLIPHLYLWKSAKWVRALTLTAEPVLGFWERLGYHAYGDPWQEQRYSSD